MKKGSKKTSRSEDEHSGQVVRGGKYRRKDIPSGHVADYSGGIARHPTAIKRSEHVLTGTNSSKSIRSLSVPSLHATVERVKYSPPTSPTKPRSKSVRVNAAKKASSFKKNFRKLFGSHLELDENAAGPEEQGVVGVYRPLNSRPRSIGGSSDCSNNSSTYTTDFSRCNSLRDSSRSKISHTDSVFPAAGSGGGGGGGRQASCDSTDNYPPIHAASGSTDSSLRHYPLMRGGGGNEVMQRSNSSTSLKTFGVQTKMGVMTDPRYHSVATDVPFAEEHSVSRRAQMLRHLIGHRQGMSMEDTESLWEDSQSFTFLNKSVVPSDPEYRQVAEELMSASPTQKLPGDTTTLIVDPRRMSDASVDPRRMSVDSMVEGLGASVKRNRSLPTTPITRSFATAHVANGDVIPSSRERSATPHSYLSQESSQSLPTGWEIAYTEQGLRYYLDHNSQSTHWELPHLPQSPEDALGLPAGWEAVKSGQYGTYYVNHNNKTAIYQHPFHHRPPPPYQRPLNFDEEDQKLSKGDRKTPARSHSHRSSQSHRILDPNSSLLRRSKSVRDQEIQNRGGTEVVSHERQLSVVTFVPPSPYQSKEIPQLLKDYVESPFGSELDLEMQKRWCQHPYEDLNGYDTMIHRLLRKGLEQIVREYEYYRVAVQQELEDRRRCYAFTQRGEMQGGSDGGGGGGSYFQRQGKDYPHQQRHHQQHHHQQHHQHQQQQHPQQILNSNNHQSSELSLTNPTTTTTTTISTSTSSSSSTAYPPQPHVSTQQHQEQPPPPHYYYQQHSSTTPAGVAGGGGGGGVLHYPNLPPPPLPLTSQPPPPPLQQQQQQQQLFPLPHHHPQQLDQPRLPPQHQQQQQQQPPPPSNNGHLYEEYEEDEMMLDHMLSSGQYDTMIRVAEGSGGGENFRQWDTTTTATVPPIISTPITNGLRRVESEGTPVGSNPVAATDAISSQSHSKAGGFPFQHQGSATDSSSGGGVGGFSELFENTQVQETFV